jgi:hypothetical protein
MLDIIIKEVEKDNPIWTGFIKDHVKKGDFKGAAETICLLIKAGSEDRNKLYKLEEAVRNIPRRLLND